MVDVLNAGVPPRRPSDEGPGLRTMAAGAAGVVVLCFAATFIPGWITEAGNPRDTVEDFFTALRSGDAEQALDFVNPTEVPSGPSAAFLDPDALSDDWTVEIPDERHAWQWDDDTDVDIPVTIGSSQGVSQTTVTLTETNGGWQLRNVLAHVTFAPSPLTYHQVNGHIPAPQAQGDGDPAIADESTYQLFPGVYRFFDDVDDLVNVNGRDTVIEPGSAYEETKPPIMVGPMQAGEDAIDAAQQQFNALLDECDGAADMNPSGCPFGTGEYVDTDDGQRVDDYNLEELNWEVEKYPTISLEDDRSLEEDETLQAQHEPGFAVVATKAGAVTLSGTGLNTDDETVDFDVSCEILASSTRAHLDQDGQIDLSGASPRLEGTDSSDTCIEEGGS